MDRVRELTDAVAVELIKLRRSLILLLMVVAPGMIGVLATMFVFTGNTTTEWPTFAMSNAAIWAFFMLPMTLTAITALLGQIESGAGSGGGMWTHLGTLPVRRSTTLIAKHLIALACLVIMSALLIVAVVAAGSIGSLLAPQNALQGELPFALLARVLGLMFLASWLMTAIQTGVALWSKNFVTPLVVGIGGTFVCVAATTAKSGKFFPWLLPVNVLTPDETRLWWVIGLSVVGGLAVATAVISLLSRRDVG
ncbi:MAG: ABC transporter permease [Planctomycetota bacterium]